MSEGDRVSYFGFPIPLVAAKRVGDPSADSNPLLSFRDFSLTFTSGFDAVRVLSNVSFDVPRGRIVAILGDTGSGKSVAARAALNLLSPETERVEGGDIWFDGRSVFGLKGADLQRLRGGRIGTVFQEPWASLHPSRSIGYHVMQAIRYHTSLGRREARARAARALADVGLPDPERQMDSYSHELSSGMRQRVCLAIALANDPDLLIADEPMVDVDPLTRRALLALLEKRRGDPKKSLLLITSDIGAIADMADTVVVLHRGSVVERGPTGAVFASPSHPYTRVLLGSVAEVSFRERGVPGAASIPPPRDPLRPQGKADHGPLLQTDRLTKLYPLPERLFSKPRYVRAVEGATIYVRKGETLGIVGESASGKTTLGRMLLHLVEPTFGRVSVGGKELGRMTPSELRSMRRRMQPVFQAPSSTLNPQMTVEEIVAEGIVIHGLATSRVERRDRVRTLLAEVGFDREVTDLFPIELSTGDRQRVGIARALAVEPDLLICDEPVNALDPSRQAEITRHLETLQSTRGMGVVFISHDLALVARTSHRVAVMHLGRIVEMGPTQVVFEAPMHPYTQALMATLSERNILLRAKPPSPVEPPAGCSFHPRCPKFERGRCDAEVPTLVETGPETHHRVACFRPGAS